ncbi:hypothetical protein NL676_004380 [Syzygium grande]|nr:hypothetical protein NL676_004380 [Syzygium grande]
MGELDQRRREEEDGVGAHFPVACPFDSQWGFAGGSSFCWSSADRSSGDSHGSGFVSGIAISVLVAEVIFG